MVGVVVWSDWLVFFVWLTVKVETYEEVISSKFLLRGIVWVIGACTGPENLFTG